jgi:hypothetical protein
VKYVPLEFAGYLLYFVTNNLFVKEYIMNSDHSPKNKHAISKTRSTSVDVAKLAGVSQATVSRAFDPTSKMRPQTRAKVLTAAKQLKYTPDAIAKSLISNTTNIIAIIMQDVVNPYYSQLLKDFSIHLQHYGKQLLYFYLDSPDNLQNLIYQVLQYRVEGIIISSITLTKQLIGALPDNSIPVVLFNRYADIPQIHSVCCDNELAGQTCADYFLSKGYRSFAFIGGSDDALTSFERKKGFLQRLKENGILHVPVMDSDFMYDSGYQACDSLLQSLTEHPRAIFCASDVICAGVMDCIRYKYKLRIPEDIALIGFDDIRLASFLPYQLTTFKQPTRQMIQKTCDLILNPSTTLPTSNRSLFPCTLKIRRTS